MMHLPAESATVKDISGPIDNWTPEQDMLSHIVDGVNDLTWLTVAVNSKKGTRNPRPARYPRPGDQKLIKPKHASLAEMKQFFGGR